jgi:DtxR family Mn-dependent transcriptional regulator
MAQAQAETECMSPRDRVSATAGRYLLELYFASSEESERVPTGELSDHLDVHPASVTEMVSTLEEAGFVDHRSHKGVEFTATGQTLAERLVWRYCVTDRFFTDMLDTHVDRETAYQMGYALPPDGIATLGVLVAVPCQRACSHLDEEMGRTDVVSYA